MGCGASNPYATYESTTKKDDKWATFTKKFGITDKEGKKLFNAFAKMDRKKKGEATFKGQLVNLRCVRTSSLMIMPPPPLRPKISAVSGTRARRTKSSVASLCTWTKTRWMHRARRPRVTTVYSFRSGCA